MLDGTKKMFPSDYNEFIETMIGAAEEDELPIGLAYNQDHIKELSLQDIHDFIYDFHNDTGLDAQVTFFMCNDCGRLHMHVEIDYSEEDDTPIQ